MRASMCQTAAGRDRASCSALVDIADDRPKASEGDEADFAFMRMEQRIIVTTAKRAMKLPFKAPMKSLDRSMGSVQIDFFGSIGSLNNAFDLLVELEAMPEEAP
eukprot:3452695-Prymnesium_polylepis.1